MKRVLLVVLAGVGLSGPASAQWLGMPVWNSPKGGTGITISGDYGKPNADWGNGNAFGARGTLGLGSLSATLGFASWNPSGTAPTLKSIGGDAAFRVIGGSLLPININLLVGGGRATGSGVPATTNIIAGGGASLTLPTPGVSLEPFVSVTERWHHLGSTAVTPSSTNSGLGWTIGANLGFGVMGAHIAYDSESLSGGGTGGILGVGLHFSLKVPLGM
ncbi:MAG TPA: hypothetical protein VFP39_09650 [Gemmatimonadales bacterium]|nr:hypothetical protein [Gemmatimonadales bacterium]